MCQKIQEQKVVHFGFNSDGKESGSDGKESSTDGGRHLHHFTGTHHIFASGYIVTNHSSHSKEETC